MKLLKSWIKSRINYDEVEKYLENGRDFINDEEIWEKLKKYKNPDKSLVREIFQKALSIETLTPDECAILLNVGDEELLEEMKVVARQIKKKVYDNRIVTFAPLYTGNYCVNNCLYCGFRRENQVIKRKILTEDEIIRETEVLAGEIGHKRLIVVYGEHPSMGVDYIARSLELIYGVKVKVRNGFGQIRRCNVNAPPLQIDELKRLVEVGIGTYQVFQETYHHETYRKVHPQDTIKGDYRWRLYAMHRALEAGVDDVGIGALFGLYDWRFEVMGLLYHARELERKFGVGPHTVSFPRLEPAANTPFVQETKYKVSDDDFEKIILVLRLAIPYAGMILTAREPQKIRDRLVHYGITQMDASTRIGIGAYSDRYDKQELERQQFLIGDTRNLDELVRDLASFGYITSFCTAGYRCGRTGDMIMKLLKTGKEGQFCKLNAVLTFKEWLLDFGTPKTQEVGNRLIEKELEEIKLKLPRAYPRVLEYLQRIENGKRDLFF
ncbi:MAG: [FeFe] hydrogenase H-cluster radical SAM maturase HydG [candidate division WOR-3 bacterium]